MAVPNGYSASILIVENDANVLHMMRDYLGRAHFKIRTADNGWDAMKRLREGSVDLIISEHDISDIDGSSFREKCLINPITRDIPFLFLVDANQPDSQVRALRSGVDDCVVRPFDPVVLVARVQAVIERRQAYEEMVRVDPLTRLLNRPSMEKDLRSELERLRRYKRDGSIVLLDVDNLAVVNEESGVAMGDLLLTCLSGVILTNIRTMDFAGRYRGEKFLIFLPETGKEGASILTTRMQERLSQIAETVAGFDLTFSAGIVTAPEDGDTLEVLMARSERALSHAKETRQGSITPWNLKIGDGEEDAS